MKLLFSSAILGAALVAATPALAQDAPRGSVTITRSTTERVRVDRVNPEQRIVGFTSLTSGKSDRMRAPPEVKNFDVLKPGDILLATTEERTTVIVHSASVTAPAGPALSGGARDLPGATPAAEIARQSVVSYRVIAVNAAKSTISLVDTAGGEVRELNVTDPAHKARLAEVRPGDGLTLIESNLLALRLEPSK